MSDSNANATAPTPTTITLSVHFARGASGRVCLRHGPKPPEVAPAPRVPRVAKLAALALKFVDLVSKGTVTDYADLARLGGVTRARVSQIVDIANLAPDILEEILFMTVPVHERDPVTERDLRPLLRNVEWERQREVWGQIQLRRPSNGKVV